MLLATREDEMDVRTELSIRTNGSFQPRLWILSDLLEFIKCNKTLSIRDFQVLKNLTQRIFSLLWFEVK